jgi:Ni/Fe-hydrogenase 1 B-type cytochrome subunit
MAQMERRHTLAVRFFHWWNAVAIFALIFSGFYIHNPYGFFRWMFADMDAARKLHFIFMYCLAAGLIGRLYYAFATGDYKNFSPKKTDMANMIKLIKYYLFITDEEPDWGEKYNPGQKGMYAAFAPLALIQIYTGMILYWPANFAWWGNWIGGIKWIREVHYIVAWIFVYCVLAHIYLDFTEGIVNIYGMFTGLRPVKVHHAPAVHAPAEKVAVKG